MPIIYQPIDERLRKAYENTDYRVDAPAIRLRIHESCPALDRLLTARQSTMAVFITAWNPGSRPLSSTENERRQQALHELVAASRWPAFSGYGQDRTGNWPAEESLLIIGPDETEARRLGHAFGQIAIVGYRKGGKAELWSCVPDDRNQE